MTLRRATLYVGGGSLLVAWFASAASLSLRRAEPGTVQPQAPVPSLTEGVAARVEEGGRRLRQRLAAAPAPQAPMRNPFAFRPAAEPRPVESPRRVDRPPVLVTPVAQPEPRLELIGVAERTSGGESVRTAMIAGEAGDLMMAAPGAGVAGRYKVTAVHADAVDLVDETTGQTRRLSLQRQ